jgi:putative heme-binding domain-containing protein
MAKRGALTGPAAQVAAVAVATCPWPDVRTAAADVLPMPTSRGGEKLPPVAELRQRKGVADRGRVVFAEAGTCAKCHVVNGEGRSVGPNLSGIGAKLSREAIYEAILAPSAAISHNYETYTALLADGRSLTGLLVSQSPEQVVVKAADGVEIAVPAADVEELVRQPVSLMPADLAAALSAEQLVDLVAYLETLKAAN